MKGPSLRYRLTSFLRRTCWPVIPITAAIIMVGVILQWSVDPDLQLPSGHVLRVGVLSFCAFAAVAWSAKHWRNPAFLFYAGALVLLILVLFVGRATNHSRRWIDVAAGFKLQPSEFMKLALILTLSRWFADHPRPSKLEHIWKPGLLAAVPAFLILIEPDLGTALVFAPLFLSMVWLAGLPWRSFRWLLLIPLLIAPAGWLVIQDYQKERILTWYHQDELTQEQLVDGGFHLWHSKMAVGSGGVTGLGWGEGPQNRLDRLPERHNDFVFPVLAEEFGFIGSTLFLLLYASLGFSLLAFAGRYRDPFTRMTLAGIGVHFLVHLCLNVGVTLGVWPTTGLPLPMVSFGGSSMIISGLAVGAAVAVGAERAPLFSAKAFEA
ncbi:MAG: rod shape-determining protein RodA [Planctomycetes bacterium]|nr:rod shape-determining protein RodA [Planctomycetota bacterium]MCP4772331.1 rod shape-determining protein RodA [Planctomycetota bacterium]MCP4861569.1 rod shape-determining protein RodA [Planctomycetota bacterium]